MTFIIEQKIRFDDVDGAGIVYYPHFFHLCHKAFEDFFDEKGPCSYPELVVTRRRGFPTVAIESEFKAPLLYGDVAQIVLNIERIGKSSVTSLYEIYRCKDSRLCFTARIVTAFMNLDEKKATPLTQELNDFLSAHMKELPINV